MNESKNTSSAEIEVKFCLANRPALLTKLQDVGAQLVQERILETNLRFDTPGQDLSRTFRALRLRQDTSIRITYKGPPRQNQGARLRQELEFEASDFDTARAFFEALGYQVYLMYEKYRAMYRFKDVLVTVDEMPYGDFAEIEGPNGNAIRAAADQLGLAWSARILDSYLMLFEHVRQVKNLPFTDLNFANFAGINITAAELGVKIADSD